MKEDKIMCFSKKEDAEKCYEKNNNWEEGTRAFYNYDRELELYIIRIHYIQ